jgi:hypothetical protein
VWHAEKLIVVFLEKTGEIVSDRKEGFRWLAGTCTMPRIFFAGLRMTFLWTLQSYCNPWSHEESEESKCYIEGAFFKRSLAAPGYERRIFYEQKDN